MPTVLFTKESAREYAKRSHAVRQAAKDRAVATPKASLAIPQVASAGLNERSNYVRVTIGDSLLALANFVRDLPWKAGMPHAQERANLIQTVVGSASKVFGWSDSSDRPLIVVGETARVLDVKSVSCGQDTPTGGSQAPVKQMTDNTSAEVPQ